MTEIAFIAYVLSLISIVTCIWLWVEVQDLKKQKTKSINKPRIVVKPKETPKYKSHWG